MGGFMGGAGGYSLQGGTATSGGDVSKHSANTVIFGNTGGNMDNITKYALMGIGLYVIYKAVK